MVSPFRIKVKTNGEITVLGPPKKRGRKPKDQGENADGTTAKKPKRGSLETVEGHPSIASTGINGTELTHQNLNSMLCCTGHHAVLTTTVSLH